LNYSTQALDSTPSTGGVTIRPVAACPMELEQRSIDLILVIYSSPNSSRLTNSIYPPLNPHSPYIPLEAEWKEINS